MLRIFLFLLTNAAVLVVISILFNLLGLGNIVDSSGTHLDLNALLMMSAVVGMTGSFISLLLSKTMAKMSMGVRVIEQPQSHNERWLLAVVQRQAQQAGIGMPEVGVFDSPSPNAFATGWNRNAALVAVSTGLLQAMGEEEVEAVLGHEISHVANGDMVTMTLLQGVLNTFVYFLASVVGFIVDRMLSGGRNEDNRGGLGIGFYVTRLVAELCLSVLATMVVMWFSRYREFRADAGGANLAGRQKMINALRALQRSQEPQPLPGEMAAFGINGGGLFSVFMSHPPLEKRIAALQEGH